MSHPLTPLFRPQSIVLIGASDRSQWSAMAMRTATGLGFSGKLFVVNKRGVPAHGINGVTSCTQIGEPVDVAFIFVPQEAVIDSIADASAAGINNAVVLTSGYSEVGEKGAALERELTAFANSKNFKFIGPNTLGTLNYSNRSAVGTLPPSMPPIESDKVSVSVVAQSGAMGSFLDSFAHQQGIAINQIVATGNEAQIGVGEVVDYLVDDDTTTAILIYAQTIRDTDRFKAAAERALKKRKPIVILKIGASGLAAKIALSHTGAVVGDDHVFDAMCRQYGVVRARSLEDAVLTAGLLSYTGPLEKAGIGYVSISGGAAEILADRSEALGIPVPPFAQQTVTALRAVLPDYAATHNPIDITGAAVRDPELWGRVTNVVARDPQIGLVACATEVPATPEMNRSEANMAAAAAALHDLGVPGIMVCSSIRAMTPYAQEFVKRNRIPYVVSGLDHSVSALSHLVRWSERVRRTHIDAAAIRPATGPRPHSERETLDYLKSRGVPVIPQHLATSAEDAIRAARELGGPVALKIASPDIAHKSDIGGVVLNLGADTIGAAFTKMMDTVRQKKSQARLEGALVSPMRSGGVELFVGITRDPQWGPVLAVGLGGVWIEALKDTAVRLLPVTEADVVEMFQSLKATKLLQGYRGSPAVNISALAKTTVAIAEAAVALGPELDSLEINPLLARDGRLEALDALVIYR